MKVIAIIQARMGSTRFPKKVMRPIDGRPLIELLIERLARARTIEGIVLATSSKPENDELVEHVERLGYRVFRGSENDVLGRFLGAAKLSHPDAVVRITGDCPLIDPSVVDKVVSAFQQGDYDYASNTMPATFPDGLDVEVFTFGALKKAAMEATRDSEREHVTPYIHSSGKFRCLNIRADTDCSDHRWTVDEPEDFQVIEAIFGHFSPRTDFGWEEVMALQYSRPEFFSANRHLIRNQGATMNSGQKLWKRAKRVIPGGNMLLSKRAEMFLPEQWPAYYSRAKGCRVWDLDEREYIDMSIMGIGTNTLGYGHPEVDEAVRRTIQAGNMSTLNCPEEVLLAERLVDLHPWSDMVRFARAGGEANAIAIRIARAASGRDKVAICGYHGWHDWYLSANLGDEDRLDGHLLPGLEPKGVPRNLRGTVFPFNYNRLDELQSLVDQQDIGVIKMEVSRSEGPEAGFLEAVRKLATDRNIVLIFDECTSGFRETFGGLHKKYGVEPDMAMFGKAMGNGYAITAILGRREIMESAQNTFISSTFWTERIGPTAALETLKVMQKINSWEQITETGKAITRRWIELADRHNLKIKTNGLAALTGFSFDGLNALAYKTLITQEMMEKGFLAATSVYVCTEHSTEIVSAYFDALDPVFALIRECEDGRDVDRLLKGPVCHAGFKRVN